MQNLYKAYFNSPVGIIEVESTEDAVVAINFVEREGEPSGNIPPVMSQCLAELYEYFAGKRKSFSVRLNPEGTVFQKKVWNELLNIPFGKTSSYLALAKSIADEKSIRAVGGANGKNKIAILVPCHRVIGSNNELVGYAGGKWRKQWLLEHEGAMSNNQQKLF